MSDRTQELAEIQFNRTVAPGYYLMRLSAPVIAGRVRPGQFLHIRLTTSTDPYLRRPISVCHADGRQGTMDLFYRAVGRGTERLARFHPGELLDILGPIGTGFPAEEGKRLLLVAGGMGIAPLMLLLEQVSKKDSRPTLCYGAKDEATLFFTPELGKRALLRTACESRGQLVTDVLPQDPSMFAAVYVCGPVPLMRRVQQWASEHSLPGYASLEERIACGIGACSGCGFPLMINGKRVYKKVCVDGPVFPLEEVCFDA